MTDNTPLVTQVDRDRAAMSITIPGPEGNRIREHFSDAFARHRLAASQSSAERIASLEARVAELEAGVREAFLNMIADATRFDEDIDGDETGVTINYHLTVGHSQLTDLLDALGVSPAAWASGETARDRLDREIGNVEG